MTSEERILKLEIKTQAIEEDLNLAYDYLDKRIDDMRMERSDRLTLCGIGVAIVIGIIQIVIALLK